MRLSCNGCRVLRKGCTPDCPIRPCLNWIKSPLSQSNATLFLAKFYGRAGLLNLLTAGAPHLRPAIFKSLLYEACGRLVNPVSGSTGLFMTGSWHLCQVAVEAVLSGEPIQKITSESLFDNKAFDIRHVAKGVKSCGSDKLHVVKPDKSEFKRRAKKPKQNVVESAESELDGDYSVSRDSGSGVSDSGSVESVEVELELTLGWGPVKRNEDILPINGSDGDTCRD